MVDTKEICRTQKNRSLIREILLNEWDPLCIKQIGAPAYEYDMYIDGVCALLIDEHFSLEMISSYLFGIQTKRMLIPVSDAAYERCNRAAQLLITTRSDFELPISEPKLQSE